MRKIIIHFLAIVLVVQITKVTANKFEPYTLNGGLASAIAGKNYVIIASDTRLSDGYNILTREYTSSRLWAATDTDIDLLQEDGSVIIPSEEASITLTNDASSTTKTDGTQSQFSYSHSKCPTFVASSGCATDCESLKRQIRSEIGAHQNWNHGRSTLTPTGVANLLGQTLYSRRTFPFYSFCVCAGLETHGPGHVHVYDAIGSHERVAVASTGNGKEMLQPILDRMFATASRVQNEDSSLVNKLQKDGRAVHASDQRVGLKLQPPVKTHVSCDEKEALAMLVRGYRSVAEREISIGDNVVVCILRRQKFGECFGMEVMRFPLKKH
jgi:20S proteasome subunit beta 6